MPIALPTPTLVPAALRCESLVDPVGVGRIHPQLSWKLEAARAGLKGLRQTAYEIRVASSPAKLGAADLWRSGRIASAAQYGIDYAGKRLRSDEAAWWSVRVWDGQGAVSGWSRPARFTMGLLSDADWKGKWIGCDNLPSSNEEAKPLAGASWIWSPDEDPLQAAQGKRIVERSFSLAKAPDKATLVMTVDDRFSLQVNGHDVARTEVATDGWRNPAKVDLTRYLRPGANTLRIEAENTSKGPAGVIARLTVDDRTIVTDGNWLVGGKPARVVAAYGGGPWGRFGEGKVLRPATHYTTELSIHGGLRRALAHVTALGLVDLSIDGRRVSEDRFTPGWTDYHKRVYARTFDVSRLLKSGVNRIALEVGDGWYSGYVGFGAHRAYYGDRPRVRAQIDLEYADGTRATVGTGADWFASRSNTVVQDFLAGEEYVNYVIPSGAFISGRLSQKAKIDSSIKAKVEPFPGVPVRAYARLKPVKITPQGNGYILDFGQNLAGFAHLKSRGQAGHRVQLQFVEVLSPDGTPYTANLRSARAIDAYTFGTDQAEEWEPRFTFHGFRYVKVTGLGHRPKPGEITAVAISSATPETGSFACSDPMLNKLAKNAWWTQKMNFIDVPTDCPQRDERLGWTGDAQAYVRTASTYSDVEAFFRKWLVALDDDQRKDGQFPQVAPQIVAGDDGGPAWADAGVICPATIYKVYGDRRLLAENYPAMRRFVEFTRRRSTPDLLPPAQFHCFGDWLSINANTPNEVIYEAYFAYSTRLLAQAARTLHKAEDAEKYESLFRQIRQAFVKAYVAPDGKVRGDTQTSYVLALGFDLLPPELRPKAAARLVENIQSRGWHLSTGFVGTRDLMRVLTEIGRQDVAFRLLHNKTFPSWGFEIANGATTVWERWDGWTPEKGFQDPGMNSFAHYAYGAVMGWVFGNVGGIDALAPGFGKIVVAPKIDPRLTWATTSFDSIRGPIRTAWRKTGGKLILNVEVPPNATAEIRLPAGGTKIVGSGHYRFVQPWKA